MLTCLGSLCSLSLLLPFGGVNAKSLPLAERNGNEYADDLRPWDAAVGDPMPRTALLPSHQSDTSERPVDTVPSLS